MKLHQIQYFIAVAQHGSFRAAAKTLGLSAAAVSKGMQELEKDLGVALLQRHTQGIALTPAGNVMLSHAKLVHKQLQEAAKDLAKDTENAPIRLSIGVSPWFALSILPLLMTRFQHIRPEVRFDIVELLEVGLPQLRDGSIDLAIANAPFVGVTAEIKMIPLFSYASTVVCRLGHALSEARSLSELQGQKWIISRAWFEETKEPFQSLFHPDRHRLDDPMGRYDGSAATRVHTAHSTFMTMSLVEVTDMLSIAPWPLIESKWLRERVKALTLSDEIPERTVSLLTHKNRKPSSVVSQFIDCLYQTISEAHQLDDPVLRRILRTVDLQI